MHHMDAELSPIRNFSGEAFNAARLAELKDQTSITVVLPARNEARTIGPILHQIRQELMIDVPVVDELLVIDDHSSDDTAAIASLAGARVVTAKDVLPEFGPGPGKGEALWKSLFVSEGEVIAWCDADITNFSTRFVRGTIGPILQEPTVGFCKGYYQRPIQGVASENGPGDTPGGAAIGGGVVGVGIASGGGRVTELMARPLIASLFENLGGFIQPLSGEFAGRRSLLEQVPFSQGYAVDLALLIDLSNTFGTDVLAQVDLGTRLHRNRPLSELGPQATAILAMALRRAGVATLDNDVVLQRPGNGDASIKVGERPPVRGLPGYLQPPGPSRVAAIS